MMFPPVQFFGVCWTGESLFDSLLLLIPILLEHLGFFLGDVDDGTVLLFAETYAGHLSGSEAAYGGVVDEVLCLGESEVVGMCVEVVVHDDPCVLTDAFPAVGGLVTLSYTVVIVVVYGIGAFDVGGCGMFDGRSLLV